MRSYTTIKMDWLGNTCPHNKQPVNKSSKIIGVDAPGQYYQQVGDFKSCVPQKHVFKDLCHCKTKRGTGRYGPTNPSLGMTLTM